MESPLFFARRKHMAKKRKKCTNEKLLTVHETAKLLRIHPDRLYKDIRSGKINQDSYRRPTPRMIRFFKSKLIELLKEDKLYAKQ